VYIGLLDYSRRATTDEEEDPQGHLNTTQPKVINYVGFSDSHKPLLEGKTLRLDQGYTGEVFKESEPVEELPPLAEGEERAVNPVEKPSYIYIANVVKDARMHYFKYPKLGAFIAVPLVYHSCLSEESFVTALEERRNFLLLQEQER